MKLKESLTPQRISEEARALQFSTGEVKHGVIYLGADPDKCFAMRPNPPTPEMVARAQPFRGDVVNLEAIIKHPTHQIDV
jgi:hypothetical protein